MIGNEDVNVEIPNVHSRFSETPKMNQDAEEGELEEGELDEEMEDFQPQPDPVAEELIPHETTDVHPLVDSSIPTVKSERRREKHGSESGKSRSHSRRRSGSHLADSSGELNKDDDGRDNHSRLQRHNKRKGKQRSKDDGERKSTTSSTYIDFDNMQDDYDTGSSWMRAKKSRLSRDEPPGPYDSPSGSDENCETEDLMQTSRSYRLGHHNYYGSYYNSGLSENEEDDENEAIGHDGENMDFGSHHSKQASQESGVKRSPPCHRGRSSSTERKTWNQMPRKRKLVDTPMEERPACKFFMEGKCVKGGDCPFNHDFVPPKKEEVCRFYFNDRGCTRDHCVYFHDDWPCRHFHKNGTCAYGDDCKFSHADLTEDTKHLIFIDPNNDYPLENWKSSSNNDSMTPSEKKKIPSLLDMEIYPPGMEPKIMPPGFLSRGSYRRERNSGQPGLLGAGPLNLRGVGSRPSSRMRPMGGNSKGHSSYGNEPFGWTESSPSHFSRSPEYEPQFGIDCEGGATSSAGGDDDDDEDESFRKQTAEDHDLDNSDLNRAPDCQPTSQIVQSNPCNLPPVQQDLYRRIQQQQQQQQQLDPHHDAQQNIAANNKSANSVQPEEKWYSSDEEVNDDKTVSDNQLPTVIHSPSDATPLAKQDSQVMQKQIAGETMSTMPPPSLFGAPPCGLMPRGFPPSSLPNMMSPGPRAVQEMMPRPNMMPPHGMPQRTMTPLSDTMSQSMGMMFSRAMVPSDVMQQRSLVPPLDMMGSNMMQQRGMTPLLNMMGQGIFPQRAMMPPTDLLGHGMMPPRGMMPPSDMMGQNVMHPRGVPPPTDLLPLSLMSQLGLPPPSDAMAQGMMPPQGVPPLSEMPPRSMMPPAMLQSDCRPPFNMAAQGIPSMSDFNINHILSIIQNSSLLPPPGLNREITSNPPNFNQSFDPRTSGTMADPRLRQNEPEAATPAPVSSFLQPPESPDQEVEINGTGKNITYTLRPITVDSQTHLPPGLNPENLSTTNDPRLRKYLQVANSNPNAKSGNEPDLSETAVQGKPLDPRLSQRGAGDSKKIDDADSGDVKAAKQPKPYSLPDIILPVLPNSAPSKPSVGKTVETATNKTVKDETQKIVPLSSPGVKPSDKTPPNLVELPEALQERNYPKDGRLSRQTSSGSSTSSNTTTGSDKKVIDYRNDPRYKKKKTKLVLQDMTAAQCSESSPAKEILSPTFIVPKEEDSNHIMEHHLPGEPKVTVSLLEPSVSDQSEHPHPVEVKDEKPASVVEDVADLKHESVSESSVHMPLAFFEGVPVSGNMSDVEPTEELNLKDMFKTIDPTTSPFC